MNERTVARMPLMGGHAPHFTAKTTQRDVVPSKGFRGSWAILFSHPADFTPACTTEFITFATIAWM